jgi:rhodanese-related sulfurtransferase
MPRTIKSTKSPVGSPEPKRKVGRANKTRKNQPAYRSPSPNRPARLVIVIGLILVAVLALGYLGMRAFGEYMPWQYAAVISPEDARKQLDAGAIVLDVRTYDEFVSGHIEKSLWMPLEQLKSLMDALPRDRLIIVVCRTGVRSAQAREILLDAGYSKITSLAGGIEAWVAAGFPTILGEPVRKYQ